MRAKKFNDTKMVEIDGREYERTMLTTLEKETTGRGFGLYHFHDMNGHHCTLQDSSVATESAIWFGVHEPEIKIMGDNGWEDVPIPDESLRSGRMHLTQEQVKALLPILTHFAETGEYIRDFEGVK